MLTDGVGVLAGGLGDLRDRDRRLEAFEHLEDGAGGSAGRFADPARRGRTGAETCSHPFVKGRRRRDWIIHGTKCIK
ncbi:hypothetical protein GCM10011314_30640 [Knoellia flava]|uniref:Uncharacterized protein n=1 Tax=Knoellia flava TaxID=913969 RepID=A0A8H9KRQ4_9MICO|nr:hypothetical protein GCM10011314_30640 [Knoellia flava]